MRCAFALRPSRLFAVPPCFECDRLPVSLAHSQAGAPTLRPCRHRRGRRRARRRHAPRGHASARSPATLPSRCQGRCRRRKRRRRRGRGAGTRGWAPAVRPVRASCQADGFATIWAGGGCAACHLRWAFLPNVSYHSPVQAKLVAERAAAELAELPDDADDAETRAIKRAVSRSGGAGCCTTAGCYSSACKCTRGWLAGWQAVA